MCRTLCFPSLTPVRLPLLCCLCTSLFHRSMHFNEKKKTQTLQQSVWGDLGPGIEPAFKKAKASNGKQLEQYGKVRCYWVLQEVNRAAQPWKPPHQQVSSDGTHRTSEGRTELPNLHLLPSSASCLLPPLPAYFLLCLDVNHHQWAGEEELSISMPLQAPEIGFWSCQ